MNKDIEVANLEILKIKTKTKLEGTIWGPVRVGARSGLGPIWAHMGPYVFC